MNEIKYQNKLVLYLKDIGGFEENWVKPYALIWDTYCLRGMQMVVRELQDYATAINNDSVV